MLDRKTKDTIIEQVMRRIVKVYPHEFEHTPEVRWRSYAGITLDILDVATQPASIERFVAVCDIMKTGFTVASKSPADTALDYISWVNFGFRVLCVNPKTTDWSVIDRDDSAITQDDKAKMLKHLYPLLRAMLGWANKIESQKGAAGNCPLSSLHAKIIGQLKMKTADSWETAVDAKFFDTDCVTGLSQYKAAFFMSILSGIHPLGSDDDETLLPEPGKEGLMSCILCDVTNAKMERSTRKFYAHKDVALNDAIRRERQKWDVEGFDFDGLTHAVVDALSDSPSGKGLTMKMCEDLQKIVSHDWMVSVSDGKDACVTTKKTIFTAEEHRKFCMLIAALREGFASRARKAETKEIAKDWRNAEEMVSSTVMREAFGQKEWEYLLSLIINRRIISAEATFPIKAFTKGTKEYKALHKNLDDLIARIVDILPRRPCYMKEYLDFLVGMRDGTLDQQEMVEMIVRRNHGIVVTQEDADAALENLKFNVKTYIMQLRGACDRFEAAGRMGGSDLLGRYEQIQPQSITAGLCVFNPIVSDEVIFRNAYPLSLDRSLGHIDDLFEIRKQIEAAWKRFFDMLIAVVPGKAAFVATRDAYIPLRDQLRLQLGEVGYPYRPKDARQRLFETFKQKLADLAMTVFECDSQRPRLVESATTAKTAVLEKQPFKVTESVKLSFVPASTKPPEADKAQKQKVGTWAKKFLSVDFETRTITFKPGTEPVTGKSQPLCISKTATKAWNTLLELLTASNDTEGYVNINATNKTWQTVLKQFVPKGRKRGIVDIYAPMTILRYHIHSEKGRGQSGIGRIRIQPEINEELFRGEKRHYEQWKALHNGVK